MTSKIQYLKSIRENNINILNKYIKIYTEIQEIEDRLIEKIKLQNLNLKNLYDIYSKNNIKL